MSSKQEHSVQKKKRVLVRLLFVGGGESSRGMLGERLGGAPYRKIQEFRIGKRHEDGLRLLAHAKADVIAVFTPRRGRS